MPNPAASFDRIARPYRWLERLTLGRALERTREHFLPQMTGRKQALILGDGDGRFLQKLLAQSGVLEADVVDTSEAMLALLRQRCAKDAARITTHRMSALDLTPSTRYDLICTHFFLDCLTQAELETLAERLIPALSGDDGRWVVSDFRVPQTGLLHWPAQLLIRSLYLAFRILTGLRVVHLPDHERVFTRLGMTRSGQWLSLGGILTSELWQRKGQ